MPYVTISATKGLSADQKKQLLEGSSDAVVQSIGAPLASVRVLLHELADGNYLNGGITSLSAFTPAEQLM